MSADANESSMVGALERGATRYIAKPIMFSDLGGLWQFATWSKSKEMRKDSEGAKSKKQPEQKVGKNEEGKAIGGQLVFKRKRLTWTKELHQRFMDAINTIGVEKARPKKILQLMNVPGLKKEKVSSYLQISVSQKYRLSLKRQAEARMQRNNITLSQSSLGSDSYNLYQTQNYLPTSKLQSLAYDPNTIYRNYNYPSNPTSMYFPGYPATFPSQGNSLGHYSKQHQNQLILPWNQQQGQQSFQQRSLQSLNPQYLTYKTTFDSNYQKGLSNFMPYQGTSRGYNQSISMQNELISPWNPQGAANTTPSFRDGFNILGGGNNYAGAGQIENGVGTFNGNVLPSNVGNSTTGGNQMHSMQQHVPQQPLPWEEIDESLGIENLQFNDDEHGPLFPVLHE
ncbi:hypothetical protein L6164_000861 [Bauhinia variegata]|uniref:Uncharacterized protein n=1 Tax=Bauhinia variegata TaxID=167791 RepID=A0ACB9Q7S0_BAUVA|nr:hypothetical protein L6164_000861 [Bauhinia variegata]